MPIVAMPDGTNVQFPDDMPKEHIRALIQSKFPDAGNQSSAQPSDIMARADQQEALRKPGSYGDATDSILTGIPFGEEITAGMLALPNAAVSAVQGKGFDVGKEYTDAVGLERELQRRRNARSPIASTVGSIAGGTAFAASPAKAGFSLLNGAKATVPSLLGRGAAEGAGYGALYGAGEGSGLDDRGAKALNGGIMGALIGGATGSLARIGAGKLDEAAIPTVQALKSKASSLYDQAALNGVTATKPQTQALASDIRGIASREGLISPTGRISEAYPKAREAVRMLDDYAGGTMNVPQMQAVRKTLADAAGSIDGGERRIATQMLKKFDDFTSPLAPELGEARSVYAQTMKEKQISDALYGADLNASASGSGANIDNASRQRVAAILKSPKKSRGFTPEERAAMENMVRGSKTQGALRLVGKAAPTGIISGGTGSAAGATIGSLIAGPPGAAVGSVAVPAVGQAAKMAADSLTQNQARLIQALIRNGGKNLPFKQLTAARRLMADLVTRSGAQVVPGSIAP